MELWLPDLMAIPGSFGADEDDRIDITVRIFSA